MTTTRTTVTSALAGALLTLALTGCGGASADQAAGPTADPTPEPAGTSSAAPAPAPAAPDPTATVALADLGTRDPDDRLAFPGVAAAFPDGSSASSDGRTLVVTTAAEETRTLELPTQAEGWFHGTTVDLGDDGIGYLVTQSGGEFLSSFLVVLDDGELYVAEPGTEAAFGVWAGEGPEFETFTTDDGAHLVTTVQDGAARSHEWTVEDRALVATPLS